MIRFEDLRPGALLTYNVRPDSIDYDLDLILSVTPDVIDSPDNDDDEEYKSFSVATLSMHIHDDIINRIVVENYTVSRRRDELLLRCWDLVAS